jgi:YggT family protein
MMPIYQAAEFLVQISFNLFILLLCLRWLLQMVRADFYNPFSQLIVKLTSPVLRPLRRIIPGLLGIDWASVGLILGATALKLSLIFWLKTEQWPQALGLLIWAIGDGLQVILNIFIFSILIRALMSWVPNMNHHPLAILLEQLTAPLLRPVRRRLPAFNGIDLTPLPVMILLYLLVILTAMPLTNYGLGMAMH